MEVYKIKKDSYQTALNAINKKYNSISIFRLLTILVFLMSIYYYIKNSQAFFIVLALLFFGLFIFMMRFHSKLVLKKQITQALLEINENEIITLIEKKYLSKTVKNLMIFIIRMPMIWIFLEAIPYSKT
jgi:hypothetical protein